ncbi:unnamed protein product [Spirodela intermedia]|uniref:BRO1 domain-containing protein n=1 Tax=Spirodela intermedia TaxID=51605 RepID=A0A7I8JUI4_SPIIN|nr:unnamed protein product [Spirodela intermedia]CAA6673391.1 unnamed protein product [Spirodela intermedia]
MGCLVSTPADAGARRRRLKNMGEVAVFFSGLRIPKGVDFSPLLQHGVPKSLVDRLSDLRTRVAVMVAQEAPAAIKPSRKTATRQGAGFPQADILQALEEYLPGIVHQVEFSWVNQVDDAEETAMANAWYEVLSVLHLMAMLCLLEANRLLLPRPGDDQNRRTSIDVFLKAAGYLDFLSSTSSLVFLFNSGDLPLDLAEAMLRALCQQALGQGVDIQLGMAIDSPKATLAVKRRFACEMVKYWNQALDSVTQIPSTNGWGVKQRLYIRWKYVEAKAAAYYYHGLILNEGSEVKSHGLAVAALQTAEGFLRESKRACEAFNSAPPMSRTPPSLPFMKHLAEKITEDASRALQTAVGLRVLHKCPEKAPPLLPDFVPALTPDEYQLPPPDPPGGGGRASSTQITVRIRREEVIVAEKLAVFKHPVAEFVRGRAVQRPCLVVRVLSGWVSLSWVFTCAQRKVVRAVNIFFYPPPSPSFSVPLLPSPAAIT